MRKSSMFLGEILGLSQSLQNKRGKMTKKILYVVLTLVVILALGLSACSKTPTTTTPTSTTTTTSTTTSVVTTTAVQTTTAPTTTTTTAADQPVYGGKINFVFGNYHATGYFDPIISAVGGWTASVTYDKLVTGDWGKGPAGTNEFGYTTPYIPLNARAGAIAETWDIVDFTTVIFHIRHGVNFQAKAPANGKEVTAADVVYTYQKGLKDPRWTGYSFAEWSDAAGVAAKQQLSKNAGRTDAEIAAWVAELKSINFPFYAGGYMVATDKYTVKYRLLSPSSQIVDVASWLFVEPLEDAKYDMQDWHNACGTGAFIVSDMVPDSSVTWTRNPNYWMTDPVHPGNKLPYVSTLNGIIIIDQATQISALRTHKVDALGVDWDKAISLKSTNPELLSHVSSPTGGIVIFMRTDIAPFKDVKVRQALCMGIDRDSIINNYYKGNAVPDAWPVLPGVSGYTPVSQMPTEVRQLYEYHPDLAKKLLSDAGYPSGFTTEIVIYQSDPDVELLTLVAEQLKSINVTATIKVVEGGTHTAVLYGYTYPQMIYTWWGNTSPSSVMGWAHGGVTTSIYAFSHPVDPLAVTAYSEWAAMKDPIAADTYLKKEYLREDLLAWEVPLPTRTGSVMWAPYLKGYHGEVCMGLTTEMGTDEIWKYFWVDPALKTKYQ